MDATAAPRLIAIMSIASSRGTVLTSPAMFWRSIATYTRTDTATTFEPFTVLTSTLKSEPTFLCDLAHSESVLPSEAYDCFLLPCTLHHFRELELCLRNVLRVVKPGGVILAVGAGLIRVDVEDIDFWHPTPAGWRELLKKIWPDCEVVVEGEGNCLSATAFNLGLALEELTPRELDYKDGLYPVVTNIYCRKPKR